MNEVDSMNLPDSSQSVAEWKVQNRTNIMTKRYNFESYDDVSDFLDKLEKFSKQENYYPDLTFSRTHVNVSIKSRGDKLAEVDTEFSKKVDLLSD